MKLSDREFYRSYILKNVQELEDTFGSVENAPSNHQLITDLTNVFQKLTENDYLQISHQIIEMYKDERPINEMIDVLDCSYERVSKELKLYKKSIKEK